MPDSEPGTPANTLTEEELAAALKRAQEARMQAAMDRINAILDESDMDLRGAIAPIGGGMFTPTLQATIMLVPRKRQG